MPKTTGKIALVTGANRGIGFEIARQLAARGITVLTGTRNEERGIAARNRLSALGHDVYHILLDVADPLQIQAAVGRIKDDFKRLDILVNNAGIMIDSRTSILELNLTMLQNTLKVNALYE